MRKVLGIKEFRDKYYPNLKTLTYLSSLRKEGKLVDKVFKEHGINIEPVLKNNRFVGVRILDEKKSSEPIIDISHTAGSEDVFFEINDFAELCGVSPAIILNWIKKGVDFFENQTFEHTGDYYTFKFGKDSKTLIFKKDIDEFPIGNREDVVIRGKEMNDPKNNEVLQAIEKLNARIDRIENSVSHISGAGTAVTMATLAPYILQYGIPFLTQIIQNMSSKQSEIMDAFKNGMEIALNIKDSSDIEDRSSGLLDPETLNNLLQLAPAIGKLLKSGQSNKNIKSSSTAGSDMSDDRLADSEIMDESEIDENERTFGEY